jgi:hypothetical protein
MGNTTKRDLKNIQILCDFWCGKLEERVAMSMLILPQKSQKNRDKYLKKLITIIRDEESRQRALKNATAPQPFTKGWIDE